MCVLNLIGPRHTCETTNKFTIWLALLYTKQLKVLVILCICEQILILCRQPTWVAQVMPLFSHTPRPCQLSITYSKGEAIARQGLQASWWSLGVRLVSVHVPWNPTHLHCHWFLEVGLALWVVKCLQYWPDTDSKSYGPFEVTVTDKQMYFIQVKVSMVSKCHFSW